MPSIIQIEDAFEFGLHRRDIFGLNLFPANEVEVQVIYDPRVIFLAHLNEQYSCSVHTGNLLDFAPSPQSLFGTPKTENSYYEVNVGVYGGTFYDAATWPTFPPCFFPRVTSNYWYSKMGMRAIDVRDILGRDALAMYVETRGDGLKSMQTLAQQPFDSH